jgi:hypothetical protein
MPKHKLRIIPLGGLGEIGKNMLALEYGNDIVVIDAGLMFPSEDMPGVDLLIPDISYLLANWSSAIRFISAHHSHLYYQVHSRAYCRGTQAARSENRRKTKYSESGEQDYIR